MNHAELVLLVLGALGILWIRHNRHVEKYPEKLTCGHCGGSGKITDSTWFGTPVRGTCPKCDGSAWSPRRDG